jgi:hypothetical protein
MTLSSVRNCGIYQDILMERLANLGAMAAMLTALVVAGCGSSDSNDGEMPALLKHRFETEMKTILRDVKIAEEQAMALEGAYLELAPLKARYLNRVISDKYTLTVGEVTADGFRAEIVHPASGLECYLEVGGSGAGIPKCD